ncbi:hypothetical protein Glove_52g42 [Diversispora epigaea]|uniref:Galactose oxidase n=1 Tax=Diversispora epigaea TaxID=1348612 RepID=A0A397JD65_9GLOM|nr:hypothetical protein Glove_52g42 [Diversispora epigaea]
MILYKNTFFGFNFGKSAIGLGIKCRERLWIIPIYSFQAPNIYAHSTALFDKKLYFIGGYEHTTNDSSSFFYLDLDQSFDITSPAYVNLDAPPVEITWATACVGGANNATIFVFGGISQYKGSTSEIKDRLIHTFDTTSKEWLTPQIEGEPMRRRSLQAVIDTKGNMYMFEGFYVFENNTEYYKDMIIFNTLTFTYSNGSNINIPSSMVGYTATLLPNGIIIYIGGRDMNGEIILIKNITMYDINEDSWNSTITKSQNDIEDRSYHSAVLTSNGRIICYGGIAKLYAAVSPSLVVLNTTSLEWRSPGFFGSNEPPRLYLHSANLFENYMIIGFGIDSLQNTSTNVYILDIRNYTWISYYEAPEQSPPLPPPSEQPKNPLSVGVIVGITIGAVIILGLLLLFGIRYYRNRSPDFLVSSSHT